MAGADWKGPNVGKHIQGLRERVADNWSVAVHKRRLELREMEVRYNGMSRYMPTVEQAERSLVLEGVSTVVLLALAFAGAGMWLVSKVSDTHSPDKD